jgi:hypothetical protein
MIVQPKTDKKNYGELIFDIKKGLIKIPKFQRDFVWSIEKTAGLLDSILKGYPIGTFILWETTFRLNDVKNIGNLKLPEVLEDTKIQYVLDGQQRITSLYAAYLGAKIQKEGEKKITDYNKIYVNLEKDFDSDDEPIVTSEKPEVEHITLNKILNFQESLIEIKDKYSNEYFNKIHTYSQAFATYDFSTIILKKDDIESAIEVFTRINTGGQTLTLFEIMSAKTYDEKRNFDMEKKFQELITELSEINYESISNSILLNSIALVISKNKECKRKIVLQLDKDKIIDVWDKIISALKESVDYFRSVYRVPVSSLLPYDALLVPFTYFFYNQNDRPKGDQAKYLEEFFWRVSLSYRYSSSTESRLAQDIKRIDKILSYERPEYTEFKVHLASPNDIIETNFRTGDSYCKAILCLLAYQEPKDFIDNGKVILDNSWLKLANSRNYHHFFPRAFLKKQKIPNENSVVNITLVNANLNKKAIKAKAPSIYISDFAKINEGLQNALLTHLIGKIDDFGINEDDYLVFLDRRAKLIFDELNNRINLQHKENKREEEIKELILEGENETFEMKSTLRYDMKINQVNPKLEYVAVKTISAFLNSDGGKLLIGVDDEGNILGLEKDFKTLKKDNSDVFELHLRQLVKKYLKTNFEKQIKVKFHKLETKVVCLVTIRRSDRPVFIQYEGKEEFFVRNGNSSIPKTRQEQSEYEKQHWGK